MHTLLYFLFAIYLTAGCYLLNRITFIKNTGLGASTIITLFMLKVCAGLLIGWMSQQFYPQGNDYWNLNTAGQKEYQMLVSNPVHFVKDIFVSSYQHGYDGFFNAVGTYWNDLKNTMIGKTLAVFNIFSRGNYYINSLFFNFFGFFGHVALYRVFYDIYKSGKWALVAGCFLLPSTLYFSSGIHKDLVVFCMLALFSYSLYFSVRKKFSSRYFFMMLFTFTGLLLIRNFVALAIIPASIGFVCCFYIRKNRLAIYISVYLACFVLLWLMHMINPAINPLQIIVQRQQDFIDLPNANSQLEVINLEPTINSFIIHAPQAIANGFLRPAIWNAETRFLVPLAIELHIYILSALLMFIFYKKSESSGKYFLYWGLFVAFSMILLTGYIVPNTGSLVRYRSLYLPFIITPILWHIYAYLQKKKSNYK